MNEEHNPILDYADSYRTMERQGTKYVDIWSVITDLERNMAPLMTAAQSELAALHRLCDDRFNELAEIKESLAYRGSLLNQTLLRAEAAEQRNADLTQALERGKLWLELFRAWFGDYGVSQEDHAAIIRTLRGLPHPPSEFDKPTESGASEYVESCKVAHEALKMEHQRITPARFKCLACGDYHEGSGNLPCPKMSPMSGVKP